MIRTLFIPILLGLIFPVSLLGQVSQGGGPLSQDYDNLKSVEFIPKFELQNTPLDSLLNQDLLLGVSNRYGVVQDVDIDLKEGYKSTVDDGFIWRYQLESDSALSIQLFFSSFIIPQGAQLFVYDSDYSLIYGAFTHENANDDGSFVVADYPDNSIVLEYFEPLDADFSGTLTLNNVGLGYRDLSLLFALEDEDELVDVNCGQGVNWQYQKHAVCKYTFNEDRSTYICSGALINNSLSDGTPYFLTASHCLNSATSASTVVAYFNYESLGCGLALSEGKTLSGATLMTTGSSSDYTLLKFNSTPPSSYQPFYAGWDLSDSAYNCVGIHHPNGIEKKISFDYDEALTYEYTSIWDDDEKSPANTHWDVEFDYGRTESGSSGSPLFNQDKRIIGQLHGGGDDYDLYGKLNYSWTNSDKNNADLSEFLTVDNDLEYIDGYFPENNVPEAVFSSDFEYVCVGAEIPFVDYSVFDVEKWHWDITPSTIDFVDGTSEYDQNPVISFNEAGSYDVKLVVENSFGSDSVTYPSMIIAGSEISISCDFNPQSGACLCSVDSIQASVLGASSYEWLFDDLSDGFFDVEADSIYSGEAIFKRDFEQVIDSTLWLSGILVGRQGVCVDTLSFAIELVEQVNDNIEDALLLETGENGPFSNLCATVEENEPIPPVNSCTSQTDWCDEYETGEDIVENSMWFYFYGPESGTIEIAATNMDGQIALYEADSYSDILAGNYVLIAANDDVNDFEYTSKINSVNVVPGQIYWLQFDGSAGGSVGDFYMELSIPTGADLLEAFDDDLMKVYPQPASDHLYIKSDYFEDNDYVLVKIHSYLGELVFSESLRVDENQIELMLDEGWCDGFYIISVVDGVYISSKKFLRKMDY